MISEQLVVETTNLVEHQLNNNWINVDTKGLEYYVRLTLQEMEMSYSALVSPRLYSKDGMIFNSYFSLTWMIFLYRLSHILNNSGVKTQLVDGIYYLNKIMHSIDWYYGVDLPIHFFAEHPLGSVLGRAKYGDYFFVYQGCTVGGNWKNGVLSYPHIGENVIMYANSTILGDCVIGNNVVISANSYLINESIPDNSIVFGNSPNIVIKKRTEKEIKMMTAHIWKWD